jgi:hypothetical protein
MDEASIQHMLINPYYAINIHPSLADEHPPLVEKDMWIQTNINLMDELGAERRLKQLLAVLQGAGPRNPDEAGDMPAPGYE